MCALPLQQRLIRLESRWPTAVRLKSVLNEASNAGPFSHHPSQTSILKRAALRPQSLS